MPSHETEEIEKLRRENIDLRERLREKRTRTNQLEYEKAKLLEELGGTQQKLGSLIQRLEGLVTGTNPLLPGLTLDICSNRTAPESVSEEKENESCGAKAGLMWRANNPYPNLVGNNSGKMRKGQQQQELRIRVADEEAGYGKSRAMQAIKADIAAMIEEYKGSK